MDNNKKILELLTRSAEVAVALFIKETSPQKDTISQRQAKKAFEEISQSKAKNDFGRAWFENLLKERKITGVRVGTSKNSKIMYSRAEILAIKNAEILRKQNILQHILK